MNRYGHQAQDMWSRYMPTQYAELENPEQYFTELGETIQNQISRISEQLERQLAPTDDYLARVGQLNGVRKQAEEIVLDELVYSQVVAEPSTDLNERLEEALYQLPDPDMIQQSIDQIWARETRASDSMRRHEPVDQLTEDDQEKVDSLQRLLELVQVPPELTGQELVTRIEQLEAEAEANRLR